MNRRTTVATASLFLILAACGDDSSGSTTPETSTSTTVAVTTTAVGTTAASTTTTTATSSTGDPTLLIEVAVHSTGTALVVDGLVLEPGVRVNVAVGSPVRIVTSGEVAEEIHVHGYDLSVDVTPGLEEVLEFIADIPGIFEVELEESGTLLFEFEVS